MSKKLLILGTYPPPIGGVTVYCKRLIEHLELTDINFEFADFKRISFGTLFKKITSSRVIHIHASNSNFRFIIIVISKLLFKRVLFTFHGNIGRYSFFRNIIDYASIFLSNIVFTINENSYAKASRVNKNSVLSSAFIKPLNTELLRDELDLQLRSFTNNYKVIFCTNAFNVSFDKDDREIYQIKNIIELFMNNPMFGLLFSDPTGNYKKYLSNKVEIPQNVFIIDEYHDFNEVLKKSNALIRFTTTDGDSISVKEALLLGKQVLASNVVSRPKEVILVDSLNDLENSIRNFDSSKKVVFEDNSVQELFNIYRRQLN